MRPTITQNNKRRRQYSIQEPFDRIFTDEEGGVSCARLFTKTPKDDGSTPLRSLPANISTDEDVGANMFAN